MKSREPHQLDQRSTEQIQRETMEWQRVQDVLVQWLKENFFPQLQELKRHPRPRILVLGGHDTTVGPQLAATIKSQAVVEQAPHGQQLSEAELKDEQTIQAAFSEPAQLIVLPFTFDHFRGAKGMDFAVVAATDLKAVIYQLLANLDDQTAVLVAAKDERYKPLFELLGLHAVKDHTLADPQSIPEGSGHLAAFVKGETIFDNKTTELIRNCDCMIGNIVSSLAMSASMLEMDVDQLGIQQARLDDFQASLFQFKKAARRLPERLHRMRAALPELSRHPNAQVRELAQHFTVSAEQFQELITITQQIERAANTATQLYYTQLIDTKARVAISQLEQCSAAVLDWHERFKPLANPVGQNNVYKAYRIITPETARQEFPKT